MANNNKVESYGIFWIGIEAEPSLPDKDFIILIS